jgi:hypothetical protein
VSSPCGRPIERTALLDYWLEETDRRDDGPIEEHLLGCDWCSGRLRGLVELVDGVRRLAGRGAIEMIITPSFLERASQKGLRAREYRVPPGGHVDCTVTADDDLLVGRLLGDFTGISHLDIVAQLEGRPEQRIADVPIDPGASELIVSQAMPTMRALDRAHLRLRLLAQEPGGERLIGEYNFHHSPSPR